MCLPRIYLFKSKPRFAAVAGRNERYQRRLTTVSKAISQYFPCSGSHMACYISSLKSPPCILLSSILGDSPPLAVSTETWGFHRMPTRVSLTAAAAKADPPREREREEDDKKKKNKCSPLPLDDSTPVPSLRRRRPTSKCQLSQELSPLFPQ